MLLSLLTPIIAHAADDISGHYFENDMRSLIKKKIMLGYSDGIYKPNKHVTRSEFAIFLIRALKIPPSSETTVYSDVKKGDWYFSAISAATNHDLINGYPDGSFKPNKNISRQEMAAMTQRALDFLGISTGEAPLVFVDKPEINPIYYSSIQQLQYLDIMVGKVDKNGNSFFHPKEATSRGESAAILNRLLHVSETEKEVITNTHYDINFDEMVAIQMTKTPKADGAGNYLASAPLVAHYANPNSFSRDSSDYLQFLILSENAGLNVNEINEKVLKGKGILEGQGQAFIDAGKRYNVNEVYLIAHALHETGNGISKLATGHLVSEVGGKKVTPKKTYNMYGIRAYDSNPLKFGSEHAYKEGWFTPREAIIGGAAFIADGYINRGQNTLYKMRWNPASPGYPQYATHVSWSVSQTNRIQEIYNLLDSYVLKYDVPSFNNQPVASPKPTGEAIYHIDQTQKGEKGTTTANLNLRTGPTTSFAIIKTMAKGSNVTLIGENGGWFKVQAGGNSGWVLSDYIQLDKDIKASPRSLPTLKSDEQESSAFQNPDKETEKVHEEEANSDTIEEEESITDRTFDQPIAISIGVVSGDNVNIRTEPDTSDPKTIITKLNKGTEVEIVQENKGWYEIILEDQTGWIHGEYMEVIEQN